MIGAIAGDIIGSPYEGGLIKTTDFPLFTPHSRFTDDTVLTVATAKAILEGGSYGAWYRELGRRHPHAGYAALVRGLPRRAAATRASGVIQSWRRRSSAMSVSYAGVSSVRVPPPSTRADPTTFPVFVSSHLACQTPSGSVMLNRVVAAASEAGCAGASADAFGRSFST